MEWRLEVVLVPVMDVNRAKSFYRDQVGFNEDLDSQFGDDVRFVQLTPPGSGCSIALMAGMAPGPGFETMEPGSLNGLQIVVSDINAARAQLIERGVEVSEVMEVVQEDGKSVYSAITGEPSGWNAYAFFHDPDGNGWVSSRVRETSFGRVRRLLAFLYLDGDVNFASRSTRSPRDPSRCPPCP